MKKLINNVMCGIIIVGGLTFGVELITHYEKYSSTARYHLMLELNKGDAEAIRYYKEVYTDNGIYLYNGSLSFDLFCENENIADKESAYKEFIASGLSLQDFAKMYK